MKAGPDIALVASLLGEPARANMLTALVGGQALTAGELAREAGVTAQTASAHLAKLEAGGLIALRRQGRHRYFTLAGDDVAGVLEGLMGLAARAGHARSRPGPAEPALRFARVCYDHLAGQMGVAMLDALVEAGRIERAGEALRLTGAGATFARRLDIDVEALAAGRRPVCKSCLDWSQRRSHLAGSLGAALLARLIERKWARREPAGRAIVFAPGGQAAFAAAFGIRAEG